MVNYKSNTGTSLSELISPEVKNILKKYKSLSQITKSMNIDEQNGTNLEWLRENISKHKEHQCFTEAQNLIEKLIKIKK